MPFPITHPADPSGPGRLIEVASFQKSSIPASKYDSVFDSCMKKVATYPIARQGLFGLMSHDSRMQVMLMDWTSAAEKDEFEPGEQYQSLKPIFGELIEPADAKFAWYVDLRLFFFLLMYTDGSSHHIILPGQATTPDVGGYLITFATAPIASHDKLASAMDRFFSSAPQASSFAFAVAAPSRENAETVMSIAGWKTHAEAEKASKVCESSQRVPWLVRLTPIVQSPEYASLQAELKQLGAECSQYVAELSKPAL
jgi:hypothetical protein